VLWCCWLRGRKDIQRVKNLSCGILAWSCVWAMVQICIWPSWCHCYSLSLAPVNPDWFLADRTIGRAFGTVCRLSVCLSVCLSSVMFCIVAKRYVLVKKSLKELIGNQGQKVHFLVAAIFLLPVSPLRPPKRPFSPYFCPYSQAISTRW